MRNLICCFMLLISSIAVANPIAIEVDVPATAKTVVFTAKGVLVDTCNTHSLEVLAGWGAAAGTYSLYPTSTELPCQSPLRQIVELSSEAKIDDLFGQPSSIQVDFDSESIPYLKVEFK